MTITLDRVYAFVDQAILEAQKHGRDDIAKRLSDALQLGSSALEILNAIRAELRSEGVVIDTWLDRSTREDIIKFVNRAFTD
ncbi:MAG TPA: hypothetical protein VL096_02005 [Pirellulaceae bacterium]|nr:hypothetical protein [Pirellulaceae bacterium]